MLNSINIIHRFLGAQVALVLLMLVASSASAQHVSTPAVLAIADSLPVSGAKALVFFRSRPTGRHVILMSDRTASTELVGASLSLIASLERRSVTASHSAVIPISDVLPTRQHSALDEARWARQLAKVRGRPVTRIGGIGNGRWVFVDSPLERGRERE
ncbi:MAG: hypothetical protein U0164_17390 [Gemmatimonadaceae bacterium]